eukprot:g11241.t1
MGASSSKPALTGLARNVDTKYLVGQPKWYVTYKFRPKSSSADIDTMFQDGTTTDKLNEWKVRPRLFGGSMHVIMWLSYLILDCPTPAEPDKAMVVGVPGRDMLWIMATEKNFKKLEETKEKCEKEFGYDRVLLDKLWVVPHGDSTVSAIDI